MVTDAYSITDSIGTSAEEHIISGKVTEFEIVNVDGAGYVTYRFDGTTAVLGAEGAQVLPKGSGAFVRHRVSSTSGVTLSLIADVATVVHIRKIA